MLDRVPLGSVAFRRTALACLVSTLGPIFSSHIAAADQVKMTLSSPANASLKIRSARQSWQPGELVPLTRSLRILHDQDETDNDSTELATRTKSVPKTVAAGSLKLKPIPMGKAPEDLNLQSLSDLPAPVQKSAQPIARATVAPPKAIVSIAESADSVSEPPKFNPPPELVTPLQPTKTVSTPSVIAGRTGKPASRIARTPAAPVERLSPAAPEPGSTTPSMDVARSKANDGWVAREAINQIAPLTDPTSQEARSAPVAKPRSTVPPKLPTDESTSDAIVLAPANTAKAKTTPVESETPPTKIEDAASSRQDNTDDRAADRSRVQVRSLKIDRDGAVTGDAKAPTKTESEPSRGSISDLDAGFTTDSSSTDRVRIASRSPRRAETKVTQPDPIDEADEPAIDADVELDFSGHPKTPIVVNRTVARLRTPIRQVLQYFYNRPEIADGRSNWGMMHAIMVYGTDTKVQVGRQRRSTIAWIAGNNVCRGKRLLVNGQNGIEADNGVGLQGHQGQFLMTLALAGVPENYPLYASGKKYSVKDLIDREAETCRNGEELTFSLIGLSHYLSTEDSWTTTDGERWDFERLIAEELAQPIVGAACGGTHRLMGFAHALRNRRHERLPIDGQWLRAENFLRDFVAYTYRMQNRDGSFSTSWFEKREYRDDTDRKIQTTGHMVEWLLTNTPDSELQNPRLVAAIQFLATTLRSDLDHDWSIGPKGHALRSLRLYYDRVFDDGPAWTSPTVRPAQRTARVRQSRTRR